MATFQGQATAADAETAFNIAEAEAMAQARAELGPNLTVVDVSQTQEINGDGTISATVTVTAETANATNNVSPGVAYDDEGNLLPGYTLDENNNPVFVGGDFVEPATANLAEVGRNNARAQAARSAAENTPSSADWRVRLSLAAGSDYLYNQDDKSGGPGILAPLRNTNGVVFPYTPTIETSYQAKYQTADLVHSNYRGYFYQNSYVDTINVKGTFTAQDTREAQYLLAVIHFFRSVTKMFYGAKDNYAGTPPPLVYLNGFGKFQFNNHPCLVSSFNYSLPSDVDYIRADGFNNYNINLEGRRDRSSGAPPGGTLGGFLANKLGINNLFRGGVATKPVLSAVNMSVNLNKNINSTYVPTKLEISIQLLPVQTRQQVSKDFNMREFAGGSLITKGFW